MTGSIFLHDALEAAATPAAEPPGREVAAPRLSDLADQTCVCGRLVRFHRDRQNRQLSCAEANVREIAALGQVGTRHEA